MNRHKPLQMSTSRKWLDRMADLEGDGIFSVGGLYVKLGLLKAQKENVVITRCKFRLDSISRSITSRPVYDAEGKPVKDDRGYQKHEPAEIRTLKFFPVYGNGDPNHENTKFWNASPSGSFELGCVNIAAVDHMEIGKEYYIDITPA